MITDVWVEIGSQTYTLNLRRSENEWGLLILDIKGLGEPKTDPYTTKTPNKDGSRYQGRSRTQERTVTITIAVSTRAASEEISRRAVYKLFPPKQEIVFGVKTESNSLQMEAIVEEVEYNMFTTVQHAIVTLLVTSPYPYDVSDSLVIYSATTPMFTFPWSNPLGLKTIVFGEISTYTSRDINYLGDVRTGYNMKLHFTGNATDITIYDVSRSRSMFIDTDIVTSIVGSPIQAGDDININTKVGEKKIELVRVGVRYNIINALGLYAKWLYLEGGINEVSFDAETGLNNIEMELTYTNRYGGI